MLFYEGKPLNKLRKVAQELALHSRLRHSEAKEPFSETFAPGCGLVFIHGELGRILLFMQQLETVRPDVELALFPAPSATEPYRYAVRVLPTHLYKDPEQLKAHLAKEQTLVRHLIGETLGEMPDQRPGTAPGAAPLAVSKAPERVVLTRHLPPPTRARFPFARRLRRRLGQKPSESRVGKGAS